MFKSFLKLMGSIILTFGQMAKTDFKGQQLTLS